MPDGARPNVYRPVPWCVCPRPWPQREAEGDRSCAKCGRALEEAKAA